MANELARTGAKGLKASGKGTVAKHAAAKHPAKAAKHPGKKAAKKSAKHASKKAAKHVDVKHAAKKSAKHAAKHPAKAAKHAAKKSAKHVTSASQEERQRTAPLRSLDADRPGSEAGGWEQQLNRAYHHLHRAVAVVSLLEEKSGGDLRMLLTHGMTLYQSATDPNGKAAEQSARHAAGALGLLQAAEHVGMAGLYMARMEHRMEVLAPVTDRLERHLRQLAPRLARLVSPKDETAERLLAMSRELLQRAQDADDIHLRYELLMGADGICESLEAGI